jgi:hypothetical protein
MLPFRNEQSALPDGRNEKKEVFRQLDSNSGSFWPGACKSLQSWCKKLLLGQERGGVVSGEMDREGGPGWRRLEVDPAVMLADDLFA